MSTLPIDLSNTSAHRTPCVAYVVKRYPRYSETFIVNEILAHEAAGLNVEVFSLFAPVDTHFQDILARVRAPVTYLPVPTSKGQELWDALKRCGHKLPDFWPRLEDARGEDARTVQQALSLALHARERGVTHLHAHFASGPASVTRLAARFSDVPYSFTAHAKDIFHQSVSPEDLRRKARDAAGIVTVSEYNVRYLRDLLGRDAQALKRVYNGLDLESFPFHSPGERPAQIVAVGRLVEKKGFSTLLDACALLAARGVAFGCDVIGAGELEQELRAQVERLGLGGRVRLLGPLPQGAVITHVQGAAVLAAPCVIGTDNNQDGLPTVLLEAMALGTPCVATDVTGIPEALHDGETGLLVPQRDPAALAAALELLLRDAELRVRLAEGARHLVEHSFDVHQNAAELRAMFGVAQPEGVVA